MPYIIRERKDIINSRPIPIQKGPRSYSYQWKMMALLDLNEDGQFVLPFSRKMVQIDHLLWPRCHHQPPPPDYEVCGCIGCENKTYADHKLGEDDDDDDTINGNLHLEEIYIESDDDDKNENQSIPTSSSSNNNNNNNNNNKYQNTERGFSGPAGSTYYYINGELVDLKDYGDDWSDHSIPDPPTPFDYDPYGSYDWES